MRARTGERMGREPVTRVMAFANQKGGTGKSTLAANVAAAAGASGRRVLVVDVDPQADATSLFGVDPVEQARTLVDVLTGECELPEATYREAARGVDLVVGSPQMAEVELMLANEMMRERFLSQALTAHLESYDLVVVDCPPNLGLLTVNALVAVQDVIGVVSMVDRNAYKGVLSLIATVAELRGHGVGVRFAGIVRTQVKRDRLTYQALQEEMASGDLPIFDTEVPLAAVFHNAGTAATPLIEWAPGSVAASAVRRLADELLAGVRVPAAEVA